MAELGLEHRFYKGVTGPWMVRDPYGARRATDLEIALRDALLASQRRELAAAEHMLRRMRRESTAVPKPEPTAEVPAPPTAPAWRATLQDRVGDWIHFAWHEKKSDLVAWVTILAGVIALLYLLLD